MPDISGLYPQYQPPPNPLATLSTVAGIQNQLNQNKLFPGQMALQQQAQQQGQLGIQASQQELAMKYRNAANSIWGALATNPKAGSADALNAFSEAVKTGVLPMNVALEHMGTMETTGATTDPDKFRALLSQKVAQNQAPDQQQAMLLGSPISAETGQGTQYLQRTPFGVTPTGFVPKGLSQSELQTKETWQTKNDQDQWVDQQGTHAQFLDAVQANPSGTRPRAAGGAPGAPATAAAGGPISGPPAGAIRAAELTGQDSATQLASDRADISQAQQRIFQAQQAMDALEKTGTGAGTAGRNALQNYIVSFPGAKDLPFVKNMATDNAAFDEANKYLSQIASSRAEAIGPHTNDGLAQAAAGSPSVHISELAAKEILKVNMALDRYTQDRTSAFTDSGQPPDQYSKFKADWSRAHDPRAYLWESLSADKRQALLAKVQSEPARNHLPFLNTLDELKTR